MPEGETTRKTDVGGRIILKWSSMDWIDSALERDQWRALVKTVMKL
jgi:hypothetical protein